VSDDLLRDDALLREQFRSGQRRALAEVYRVYLPLVVTVVSRGFGGFRGFFNPSDRDDAIQTIFTAAFEERARLRYNGLDPYSKYLRGIAQNTCRKMLEKRARFARTDGQPELEVPPETAENRLISAQEQEILRKFRDSVDTEPDKTVLQRYFVLGHAEETIAREVGLTRYRLRKVIALLHRRMVVWVKEHGLAHG
jgi:RNA polymerase sigma factor (sigma-70 family)